MISFDLHPYTLLISVFIVLLFKQAVGHLGKSSLHDLGWIIYSKVASKLGNKQLIELAAKKHELRSVTKEKKSISAQDEYARWTKLNRLSDKLTKEINQLDEEVLKSKSQIDKCINFAIFSSTSLPIWFFRIWFRKSELFYLPKGVLPSYIEWFLALPFFTTGAVGLTVWMFAVNNVLSSLLFLITFSFENKVKKPEKVEKIEEVERVPASNKAEAETEKI